MRKEILKFAFLLLVALGAPGAYSSVYQWSQTAASNATADPAINWAEGMSPSSVNDSARAMMAQLAKYRDDISGAIVTTGSATALVATSNSGVSTPPVNGQMIAITPNATNDIGVTLNIDVSGAFPIYSSAASPVGAGVLVLGSPYTLKFVSSIGTSGAWVLRDFYGSPFTIPIGGLMPYTGDTSPNSSLILPYGQCLSRSTYAVYFSIVGTRFGACDGSTTFAAPDWRGRTFAGADNMGGTPANRLSGYTNGSFGGNQSTTLNVRDLPDYTLPASFSGNAMGTRNLSGPNLALWGSGVLFAQGDSGPISSSSAGNWSINIGTPSGSVTVGSLNGGQTQTSFSNIMPVGVGIYLLRVI